MAFASAIGRRATTQHRQPAPESLFVIKLSDMSDDAQKRFLQRITSGVFVTARNDHVIAEEALEIEFVKLAKGIFISRRHGLRQCGNFHSLAVRLRPRLSFPRPWKS